jgi:hypothetical protein
MLDASTMTTPGLSAFFPSAANTGTASSTVRTIAIVIEHIFLIVVLFS